NFCIGFGVHQAGKAIAGLAPDAGAVRHVALVQHDRAGRREWMVAGRGNIVAQLLDTRSVGEWRTRIRATGGGRTWRLPPSPVNGGNPLRFGVIWLPFPTG